jgi:hypothetical protein
MTAPGRPARDGDSMITVVWMRHRRSRIAHAFVKADVTARLDPLVPIKNCDQYPFADVVQDDLAERCRACVPAAVGSGRR